MFDQFRGDQFGTNLVAGGGEMNAIVGPEPVVIGHLHGEIDSAKGRAIKAQIREAFYQDADDWKEMIWERAVETQRLATAGLSGG